MGQSIFQVFNAVFECTLLNNQQRMYVPRLVGRVVHDKNELHALAMGSQLYVSFSDPRFGVSMLYVIDSEGGVIYAGPGLLPEDAVTLIDFSEAKYWHGNQSLADSPRRTLPLAHKQGDCHASV
jgi:hypothetical protein